MIPLHPIQDLQAHLERVFGDPVELSSTEGPTLPAYLARAYTFWRGELVGHEVLFACARRARRHVTAKRIEADARALQAAAEGEFVVLVLARMEAHVRRRLLRGRVPFVVPGRQLFLPTIGLDLQERDLGPARAPVDQLEWASQVTVLRHLLWRDVQEKSLRAVAALIGYSAMTLSNVQRQLVSTSIARIESRGRAHTLLFDGNPRDAWTAALPHLRTPVRRATAVRVVTELPDALPAGLSALAQMTAIADTALPTLAIDREHAARALQDGCIEACPDADEADVLLEIWNYDPRTLAQGHKVDPLSLYLSVRDDPDARMEQAAEQLLDKVKW